MTKIRALIMQEMSLTEAYRKHALNMAAHMEQYLTTNNCRRFLLLSYFDANIQRETEPRTSCCDNCDKKMTDGVTFTGTVEKIDVGPEAKMLFEVVKEVFKEQTGLGKPVDFIRGSVIRSTEILVFFICRIPRQSSVIITIVYLAKEKKNLMLGGKP